MSSPVSPQQEITIRPARATDAAEIANVHINAWREAYRDLLPRDYLERLPLGFRNRYKWWEKTIRDNAKFGVFVAEAPNGIVGFCSFEPARDESLKGRGELTAIYLFERFKGQQIGFRLLAAGMKELARAGYTGAYCWVLDNNPTLRFYERTGGKPNGMSKSEEIGSRTVREIVVVWDDLSTFLADPLP